jgi:hypothetical protein
MAPTRKHSTRPRFILFVLVGGFSIGTFIYLSPRIPTIVQAFLFFLFFEEWAREIKVRTSLPDTPNENRVVRLYQLFVFLSCLLLYSLAPYKQLLAPLLFAALHAPLMFIDRERSGKPIVDGRGGGG